MLSWLPVVLVVFVVEDVELVLVGVGVVVKLRLVWQVERDFVDVSLGAGSLRGALAGHPAGARASSPDAGAASGVGLHGARGAVRAGPPSPCRGANALAPATPALLGAAAVGQLCARRRGGRPSGAPRPRGPGRGPTSLGALDAETEKLMHAGMRNLLGAEDNKMAQKLNEALSATEEEKEKLQEALKEVKGLKLSLSAWEARHSSTMNDLLAARTKIIDAKDDMEAMRTKELQAALSAADLERAKLEDFEQLRARDKDLAALAKISTQARAELEAERAARAADAESAAALLAAERAEASERLREAQDDAARQGLAEAAAAADRGAPEATGLGCEAERFEFCTVMAPGIASCASSDDLSLPTSGRGGLRRVQSAPVLPRGPVVMRPAICPALAWADMLELDALLPDDSHTPSGGAGLSAILAGLDDGRAFPDGRSPFEAPVGTLPPSTPATSDRAVNCTRTRLSTKARPFVAAGAAAAETLWQRSAWACGRDSERPSIARQKSDACSAPETRTTVMMRNVPYRWTRQKLLTLLDSKGFATKYDFVYQMGCALCRRSPPGRSISVLSICLGCGIGHEGPARHKISPAGCSSARCPQRGLVAIPVDFETTHSRGFSFVNLTSVSHVKPFVETFGGFCDWQSGACKKKCEVCWSETQTLESNILRYKGSLVMDPSVPDDFKPIVLKDGVRIPFPQSIREYHEFGQKSGTRNELEAAAAQEAANLRALADQKRAKLDAARSDLRASREPAQSERLLRTGGTEGEAKRKCDLGKGYGFGGYSAQGVERVSATASSADGSSLLGAAKHVDFNHLIRVAFWFVSVCQILNTMATTNRGEIGFTSHRVLSRQAGAGQDSSHLLTTLLALANWLSVVTLPKLNGEQWVAILVDYLEDQLGHDMTLSMVITQVSAALWANPHVGRPVARVLPCASVALAGWRVLRSPASWPPLPIECMAAIAVRLAAEGELLMTLFAWVSFETYRRPSEQFLVPLLLQVKRWAGDSGLLLPFFRVEAWVRFQAAPEAVIFGSLRPTLYGASHDRATNSWSAHDVQARGLWKSSTLVMRYEKHSRLALAYCRFAGSPVVPDAFGGQGGLAKAARRRGYVAIAVDLSQGEESDLLQGDVVALLIGWINSGQAVPGVRVLNQGHS
ncbi:unnamed protein product [Prorocentrum cordatum]|uniref:Uncharacterized protein n=1 Tax=Prorocentrum cordatum TaxID=2364126 RepID=A0ABN9S986_9DINO|nr:unnamed protein product [Polarella glacialis]